jgi:HEAT repeat protein
MIKTLTTMPRRTPILAIILAPVALYLLVLLWEDALVPLYRTVWYSDTVLKWRLDSDEPAVRIGAIKDAGSWRAADAALLDKLVASLQSDESVEVRKASATTLGGLGSQRQLPAAAIQGLSALVLNEQDVGLLSAAIAAVGKSAAENRYTDDVVERIAEISSEKHLSWMYPRAATALGQIGAAQPLPDLVFAVMNTRFADPQRDGEREDMANAFAEIAKGEPLPVATLDMLADAFEDEPNHRIHKAILYTLAYAAADYPRAITVITAATHDPDENIVATAQSGLRIIEYNRTLANKDPISVATDASEPVATRLNALRIIRGTTIDPAAYEQVAALAQDPETEIAVAAIEMFHWLAGSPDDDFDQGVLIPALSRAMSDPDPLIRYAAYGQLSTISRNRPAYLQVADFPGLIEAGVKDPDPRVRVVVMVMLLRDDTQRAAIIERGMSDADPYVRRNAVSWLALPETKASQRQAFMEDAINDPHPDVRRSAAATQQNWDTRERAWPVKLWLLWQEGERGQVGMTILIAVTVATPILIGGIFLLYYMARLLTYLQQRRWRATATVSVMAAWALASYGMFMLYFAAGFAGDLDRGEIAILAGILWGAIVVYSTLGWGLHYAVRR